MRFKCFLISALIVLAVSSLCMAKALPEPLGQVEQPNPLPVHQHTANCELTQPEPVQIICILDRSGSMRELASDTIGGYNSFLEKQKKEPGTAEVTTVLFDDRYEKIVDAINLQNVPEMTSKEYYARGMTALLDAVGRTITSTLGRMANEGICPAKRRVLVLIMTDGQENDSKEYNKASVKAMIDKTTEEYKWNYVFMGANIDSVAEAESIGISAKHAVNYDHDASGVARSFERMDAAVSEMRETGSVGEVK